MIVRDWRGVARYGLPGLILGAVVSWVAGARGPEVSAQTGPGLGGPAIQAGQAPPRALEPPRGVLASGESGGTMAFLAAAPGAPAQFLYLVDSKAKAFAVYRVDPNNPKGTVKLEAARQYEWDLRLEHYNNQAPEPSAIEATVKALPKAGRPPQDR